MRYTPFHQIWPPYLRDAEVARIIGVAQGIADWIASKTFSGLASTTESDVVAAGAFRLAHEHHYAIVELFKSGRSGSALALLRPCFESLAIGVWCRDGGQSQRQLLDGFIGGRSVPDPEGLLRKCRNVSNRIRIDALLQLWLVSKPFLHNYTHSGYLLIRSRESAEEMLPLLVTRAVRFATQTALQALHELAVTFGDAGTLTEIQRRFDELGPPDDALLAFMASGAEPSAS